MPDNLVTPWGNIATRVRSDSSHAQRMLFEGPNEQPLYIAVGSTVVTSMAAGTSAVTLLSALSTRRRALIFNDANTVLYLKLGTGASSTSFTVKVDPDGLFELPTLPVYTGDITGVWAAPVGGGSPTGAARMTEM